MINHYVSERLGLERMAEALRVAEDARRARLAEAGQSEERKGFWSTVGGRMMPDAAGAREVPSL
jgi:hypothetical protein